MTGARNPERRLGRQLRLSRAALAWERLWPASWPVLCVLGAFAVLALFDLLTLLPAWLHAAVLVGFGIALGATAFWGLRAAAWPDAPAARRRIELASGLGHRPLAALIDHPSTPLDREGAGLWEAHQRRMAALVRRLHIGWPVAGLASRDPWGIRAVLVLLLVLAVIDARSDWRDRLFRSLTPSFAGGPAAVAASFDIWITPPEYTGLAPQFLRADTSGPTGAPIRVPTGSVLLAQIHGGHAVPRLAIDSDTSDFAAIDKDNFRAQATLTKGQSLEVRQGGTVLGHWPIEIIPDEPPVAAFAEPPRGTARATLKLDYKASDDYGVESVKAVIRRQDGTDKATVEIDLPLPGLHLKEAQGTSYQDLSPHPWAGLPVEIRLRAIDAIGQTGDSEPVRITLPERVFNHPIARAIIDERKELVRDPGSREAVSETLGDLNKRPALYRDDIAVFLALRLASLRLLRGDPATSITVVVPLLWDTALRIEDGSMSLAEREVRRLQQELQDALAKNAPDEEIDRLMRDLRQALDQYLQALGEDMQRHPDEATAPIDPSKIITSRDLQRMLDRARELARSGAQQQARELLSQLQDMLENMRTARPGQMRQHGSNQAQQMMRGLREMMQQQQQLLDRSFRTQRQQDQGNRSGQQAQKPGDSQDPGQMGDTAEMSDEANQQEALRHMLGEIMRGLGDGMGDIPDPFGRAERAMHDATEALQRGEPGDAIAPQTEALDQLQQAARDMAKAMQKQLGSGWGEPGDEDVGTTDRDGRDNTDRDPFGRPLSSNGPYDQGDVAIPDMSILQRSRQILDELRRRAGERSRPAIELDYIDRLLRRF
jgi:uncharacterized protein (TIGR02302 family)